MASPSVRTFFVQLLSDAPVGSPLSMPIEMAGSDLSAVTNAAKVGGECRVGGRVVVAAGADAAAESGGAVVIDFPASVFLVADFPILDVRERAAWSIRRKFRPSLVASGDAPRRLAQ